MYTLDELDELGRARGVVIYSVHHRRAGWGIEWFEGDAPNARQERWEQFVVYNYYPTVGEMIINETERVKQLEVVTDA